MEYLFIKYWIPRFPKSKWIYISWIYSKIFNPKSLKSTFKLKIYTFFANIIDIISKNLHLNRNWQIFSWKFKKYYEKYKVFAKTTKKYQVFYKNLRKIPNLSRKSRKNTKFLHKLRKNYTKMKIFHNLRDFLQIFFLKSTFQKKYEQLQ